MVTQANAASTPKTRGIASAGFWAVGGKLVSRLFDIATLVILTAILEPADFGLVAKAMTVVMLVELITLLPVETSILRVRNPERNLYDTAFTLNLIRALLIGAILVGLSGPLSVYFKDPRLMPLMCWLALGPALRGAVSPKMAEFTRAFDMRPEAFMDISSKAVSLVVVTLVAIYTHSYWAIAVGTVTTAVVLNVLSYILAPYRPHLTLQKWHEFKDIFTWVTLTQALQAINWQLDNFILGRLLGNDAFGRYSLAKQLNDIPFQALAVPVTRPMVASFTNAETDADSGKLWIRFSNGMLFSVGAILVTLAVLSNEVIFVLLGPGWDNSSLYLTGLAIATLPSLPAIPLNPFAVATFRSRLIATRVLLQVLLMVPAVTAGALVGGIFGVIVAKGCVEILMLGFVAKIIRDQLGLPIGRQIASYWRSLSSFVLLAILLYWVRDLGAELTDGSRVLTALRMTALSLPCIAIHVGTCLLLWHISKRPDGPETYLWNKLSPKLRLRRAG